MGRTGVGGHNMINMTMRELYYTLSQQSSGGCSVDQEGAM
jgi:hypothetical protein